MYLNKIIIIGRVGKDPDVKKLDSGMFATFSIATTEGYKNKAGEKVENTTWHNVKCFGKQAEFVEKYITKGMMMVVEGSYLSESYEKDGQKRTSYYIKPSEIKFGDNPKVEKTEQHPTPEQYYTPPTDAEQVDDDLPF